MKKLMIAVAAVACAFATQAASMKWGYASAVAENGYRVYALLGATAATDWTDEGAVAAVAIGDPGTVGKVSMNYLANGTASSASLTDSSSVYFVLVNSAGTQFAVTTPSVPGADYVYGEQESEKTAFKVTGFGAMQDWASGPVPPGPTPGDVPEPTSAMLVLLGVAGLALRRKQA